MSTFGIELLDRSRIILLVGRPASGKTTALKVITHQIVKIKESSFSRSYVSTKSSGDFRVAPDETVFEDYSQEYLKNMY